MHWDHFYYDVSFLYNFFLLYIFLVWRKKFLVNCKLTKPCLCENSVQLIFQITNTQMTSLIWKTIDMQYGIKQIFKGGRLDSSSNQLYFGSYTKIITFYSIIMFLVLAAMNWLDIEYMCKKYNVISRYKVSQVLEYVYFSFSAKAVSYVLTSIEKVIPLSK